MGIERGQGLEHHPGVAHGVQHAAAIDVEPQADVHRVAGLAHEDGIALLCCDHRLPALALRVAIEGIEHGAQVGGVHRVLRKFATKTLALYCHEQAPAIKGLRTAGTDHPRPSNQAREFCCRNTHRVSPGNSRAV